MLVSPLTEHQELCRNTRAQASSPQLCSPSAVSLQRFNIVISAAAQLASG